MNAKSVLDKEIMTRLNEATQVSRDKVKNLPFNRALMNRQLPLNLYIGQLEAYLPVYHLVEHYCETSEHPLLRSIWRSEMSRSHLLEADLADFSLDIPTAVVQRATQQFVHFVEHCQQSPSQILGVLYALEMMLLDVRNTLPHIQVAYNLQNNGINYYRAASELVVPQWKMFKQRMNQMIHDEEIEEQIVHTAEATFQHLQEILNALWKSK